MKRRTAVKQLAATAALSQIHPFSSFARSRPLASELLVGVQISPHNLLDEGLEHALDILQKHAGVNALFLLSHGYYGAKKRPPEVLAPDHGVPVRDERKRVFPWRWVKHREAYFKDTSLRHAPVRGDEEYAQHDVFNEIRNTLRQRGVKLYARFYEALFLPDRDEQDRPIIANWPDVRTVDALGNPGDRPCWNNPDYRAFMVATVKDMFSAYELDGLQYGSESDVPLSKTIYKGQPSFCFCTHCRARNAAFDLDAGRAREGYQKLYHLIQKSTAEGQLPYNGLWVSIQQQLQQYPEMSAWNYQWMQAEKSLHREMYRAIKSVAPQTDVGWHVDHQRSTWDLYFRSAMDYREMSETADFIKPIMYSEVMGKRMKGWVLDLWRSNGLAEYPPKALLQQFYAVRGYDSALQPSYSELEDKGFHPQYVGRETQRCVTGTGNQAKTYSGIGLDVPWSDRHMEQNHENIYLSTRLALEAGAEGIVVSREYGEMRIPSLKAVGRAIREY